MRSVALFVQFCLVLSSTHAVILRHSVSNHRKGAYHKASKRVAKHVLRAASQAPNMTFSWAPELWKNAPAVPIWSSYFKNAVPNPEVPASDVYTCTVDPTMWGVTIDDGPSPLEPQTRAYFAQKNISTSFFHIGTMVAENPQVLLDTFNAGHMIGLHTWSHPHLTNLTDDQIYAEIVMSAKAIYQVIGQVPKYLRPPYGNSDARVRRIAATMGVTLINYGVDSQDWLYYNDPVKIQVAKTIIQNSVKSGVKGPISLQHDVWQPEIDVGKQIFDEILAAGYQIKPIHECLGDPSPYGNKILEGFFLAGQFENKQTLMPIWGFPPPDPTAKSETTTTARPAISTTNVTATAAAKASVIASSTVVGTSAKSSGRLINCSWFMSATISGMFILF